MTYHIISTNDFMFVVIFNPTSLISWRKRPVNCLSQVNTQGLSLKSTGRLVWTYFSEVKEASLAICQ
jgi:hypothetical protein